MHKLILACSAIVVLVALSACSDHKSSGSDAAATGGRAGASDGEGGAGGAALDCTGEWPEAWQAKEAEALHVGKLAARAIRPAQCRRSRSPISEETRTSGWAGPGMPRVRGGVTTR